MDIKNTIFWSISQLGTQILPVVFTSECRADMNTWRRRPVSFQHVCLRCLLFNPHLTTYTINYKSPIKQTSHLRSIYLTVSIWFPAWPSLVWGEVRWAWGDVDRRRQDGTLQGMNAILSQHAHKITYVGQLWGEWAHPNVLKPSLPPSGCSEAAEAIVSPSLTPSLILLMATSLVSIAVASASCGKRRILELIKRTTAIVSASKISHGRLPTSHTWVGVGT